MDYAVYKLEFTTALHIGNDSGSATLPSAEMTIHSDTLFSALCIESIQAGGKELLRELYNRVWSGELIFSDLFPYRNENYFLPKPILKDESLAGTRNIKEHKAFKRLKYISASSMADYLAFLRGRGEFDVITARNGHVSYEVQLGQHKGRMNLTLSCRLLDSTGIADST